MSLHKLLVFICAPRYHIVTNIISVLIVYNQKETFQISWCSNNYISGISEWDVSSLLAGRDGQRRRCGLRTRRYASLLISMIYLDRSDTLRVCDDTIYPEHEQHMPAVLLVFLLDLQFWNAFIGYYRRNGFVYLLNSNKLVIIWTGI